MPPRRKAAPAKQPTILEGCAIALSGKFDSAGFGTHSALEAKITHFSGKVTKSITKATTHLVCSQSDYDTVTAKVAAAKEEDIPVVSVDWILDSEAAQQVEDCEKYKFGAPAASNGLPSRGKKRSHDAANGVADDEADAKKSKGGKTNGTNGTNGTIGTNGKAEDSDVKEEKHVAEGQFMKKKDAAIPIDEFCPLMSYVVYVDPDDGMIWDASLNQSNSGRNNNKFYRIQVLHDLKSDDFKTWTRWGRVGEAGQNAILGNGTLKDATKNFEKKFKDKSGLAWANRGDDPKPNKYAFVERSYNPDSDEEEDDDDADDTSGVKKEEEDDHKPPESKLDKPAQDLMALIFNQQYFQDTMNALNYDANKMPLGKLSKATITRGFQTLKNLAALMDDPDLAASKYQMSFGAAQEELSNTYYSVIPHAFGRNRPPIISNDNILKKEVELLESLSDMKDAAEIMKVDRKSKDTIHMLDKQFQGLGLEEMSTLDKSSDEFTILSKYLNDSRGSTHHMNYRVEEIFRIERKGEKDRFDSSPYAKMKSDRRLLWHGSRATNYGGILSQGLRIAPPEAPVSGYMFGKGIYLADMSSKSANYCCSYNTGGTALLLLCEAELGDPMQKLTSASYTAGDDAKSKGMVSTWGMGTTGPSKWTDAGVAHESLKGIKMPDTSTPPGQTNVQHASLLYNEFICYDVAQVKLRYLLRVRI